MMNDTTGSVIVGGGVYGVSLALHEARRGAGPVALVEREPALLQGASRINQARVHMGYHYPRSFLTAARSQRHHARFVAEFADCVDTTVAAHYAIARRYSKVSARQFVEFCHRIGAPVSRASEAIRRRFNLDLIEEVFRVEEAVFDAERLSARFAAQLAEAGVVVHLATEATGLARDATGWTLRLEGPGSPPTLRAERVYNCTYAGLNRLLRDARLPVVPLKHEVAELALVTPPPSWGDLAVTVMCGPFFSLTPLPAAGCHVLSHVRYTPHAAWHTGEPPPAGWTDDGRRVGPPPPSRFLAMRTDAARYLPELADTRQLGSWWAVKTVLPRNEVDDGRPILLHRDPGAPGLTSVIGSKVDNVYDVLAQVAAGDLEKSAW
jgi:glycine/D-amino acid oxidase-like deaminating enzyme